MDKILAYFSIKYEGDWDSIYKAINQKERIEQTEVDRVVDSHDEKYITLLNENYPSRLKSIYKPPFVLFYKGDINLINSDKAIAIIGSRDNSEYGKNVTDEFTKGLVNEGYCIVSGLAKGIDAISHTSCLANGGKTIAVLGNGLNTSYPKENEDLQKEIELKGLVVSEYPNSVGPNKENFPSRNRIVAGLSDGVLVTEAKKKSGTMITIARALEMGKEVFCIPHRIDENSGCNSLIKEGAKLVENYQDILNEL